ncbi:MAG: protein translocase subunit SecF [Chloroflexi bacterium]|nr:protein translocase subunit SecF [Chloroflexota bacterium]
MPYDLVGKRFAFLLISLLMVLPGIFSLILPGGLRPGIDFTSGSIMTVRFQRDVDQPSVRQVYAEIGLDEAVIQRAEDGTYIVRTKPLEAEIEGSGQGVSGRQRVEDELTRRLGALTVLSFDQVSPIVAAEIVRNAILAVLAACLGILLYLWWAFRRVADAWRYGFCSAVALIHVALVVVGVFSLLGRIFAIELDALFITAILTVIGYSVNDTIVVFDRVRENSIRRQGEAFEDIVNHALMETMVRSLNTGVAVMLTMFTLWLFGGVTLRNFMLALLLGVIVGSWSSHFYATMLLVVWENGELGRLFGRRAARPALRRA